MQNDQKITPPSNPKENVLFAALGGLVAFIVGLSAFQGDHGTSRDLGRDPASVQEESDVIPFSDSQVPPP